MSEPTRRAVPKRVLIYECARAPVDGGQRPSEAFRAVAAKPGMKESNVSVTFYDERRRRTGTPVRPRTAAAAAAPSARRSRGTSPPGPAAVAALAELDLLPATEELSASVARLYAALLERERTLDRSRRILGIDDEQESDQGRRRVR